MRNISVRRSVAPHFIGCLFAGIFMCRVLYSDANRFSATYGDNLSIHTNQSSSIIGGIVGPTYVDYARDFYSPVQHNNLQPTTMMSTTTMNNCGGGGGGSLGGVDSASMLLQMQRDPPTYV